MKRLDSFRRPWALLAPSAALLSLVSLYGCNDEVEESFPCAGVACGENAFCVTTTGECSCDLGFELNGEVCELPGCTSDLECDDGLACNGDETCDLASGQCQVATPVVCGDNSACEEASGDCECLPLYIDLGDGCEPMTCAEDNDCDDGLTCNGAETCDLELNLCKAGTPIFCGDEGTCEEPDGLCSCPSGQADFGDGCEPIPCDNDATCDDGVACNGTEICNLDLSVCEPGQPVRCGKNERCEESADNNICVVDQPEGTSACMLIGTTDWATIGSLAIMDLGTGEIKDDITSYAQDSGIRVIDQEVYILERHMYDSVLKLDQRTNYQTVWNFSVATNDYGVPNPHDMVRWGDYFFLALYNDGAILRANAKPNLLDPNSFLGLEPYSRLIEPPIWDGLFSELTALRVEGDILYGLTQGLADSWTCDTDENRSRIYAFNLPDLTDANIFEDGTNFLTLEHCNHGGWVPMPDGRLLTYALAGYRSIHGTGDDGGMQIFDIAQRKLGPVVATETDANDKDIFSVIRVGQRYFSLLAGEIFGDVGVYEVYPTADDSTWRFDSEPFYAGSNPWSIFGFDDTLYIAERSGGSEALYPYGLDTKEPSGDAIETRYAPESMKIFYREDGCW